MATVPAHEHRASLSPTGSLSLAELGRAAGGWPSGRAGKAGDAAGAAGPPGATATPRGASKGHGGRAGDQSPTRTGADDGAGHENGGGAGDVAAAAAWGGTSPRGAPGGRGRRASASTGLSGSLYCASSMGMILLNKCALSSFDFACPTVLLLFQCLLAVSGVLALGRLGVTERASWDPRIARVWAPAALAFVAMLATSFWALGALSVAMATLLKNLTNVLTAGGDYALYGRTHSLRVWGCMALMAVSAAAGGATDLQFSAAGYLWQLANCAAAAAYSLALRGCMDSATRARGGRRPTELALVLHNNVLSAPLLLSLAWARGELVALPAQPALRDPAFLAVALASGLIGFSISFTSLWFIGATSPTVYSLTGSLNKVPVAILGVVLFDTPLTVPNAASIAVGLAAGVLFVLAKGK